jgi:signal transduction histidine kinase
MGDRDCAPRKIASFERRLRETIRARDQALTKLAQSEKLAVLGQLLSTLAHDLNNVMQSIVASAELIRKNKNTPEIVNRVTAMQSQSAERGASILRHLLSLVREERPQWLPIDVRTLLNDVGEFLSVTHGNSLTIKIETEPDLPLVYLDRTQLETALINLAMNGRDAMEGSGPLTLSARRAMVARSERTVRPGDYVRIDVVDTGSGMNAATLARASEPFFTTKPIGKGTGLGLSMAHRFAEQSGGALSISSAPGAGTTVTLWLRVRRRRSKPPRE